MANIFFISISIILLLYILRAIKKNFFSESESIFWFFGGIFILVLAIFPELLDRLANLVGIDYPPSMLFLLGLFFLLFINFSQDKKISSLNEKVKELVQHSSLLEEKLRQHIEKN